MSERKQKCELNECNRAASTFCYCCKTSICTRHFTEHIEAIRGQVDPLANTINTMVEKIQNLTIEQFVEKPLAKLNQWKCDMHQLIDDIFWSKSKEIEEFVKINQEKFTEHKMQQWENIMKIQGEVRQLVEDGDATFQQIELLKNQLTKIEEIRTTFESHFLTIDTQVSGHGFVTVSSTLNKPSISSNIPPSQFSISTSLNVPVNPVFDASTYQPSAFQTTYPTNPSGSSLFSFGGESTMTRSSGSLFPSVAYAPPDNPFSTGEDTSNCRPVLRVRRRGRP